MRERWGTFSVRDHLTEAPFVSDVLLYDRLVIPVPDPTARSPEAFWQAYKPELLSECLEILGVKTAEKDGLVLAVPWDTPKQERFDNRMRAALALATQNRNPKATCCLDPYGLTVDLLKEDFRPALPPGVSKAWTVAAYTSAEAFDKEKKGDEADRPSRFAALIRHQFLTPAGSDPDHELLKRAIDLATTDDFRKKRAAFYQWQEEIIEEQISDDKAVEELENRLIQYQKATQNAFRNVATKFAFTLIPVGLTIAGAAIAGAKTGVVIATASGLVHLAKYWKFDRKPVIEAGDLDGAAMIHDVKEKLLMV